MRKKMSHRKDARIFKKTANRTRKINIAPRSARGGIRL